MLYSHVIHIQLYTYTCRNILNTITTSEDTPLEKYTSHFIESAVCENWRLNKDCNILTSPASPDIAVCLSRSPELLKRGAGAQVSAERLFSLLDLEHCFKL